MVYSTNPFEAGDSYTFGWVIEGSDPVRISAVELVESRHVRVIDFGARQVRPGRDGIGLVPGWSPQDYDLDALSHELPGKLWELPIEIDIGIEVLAVPSGFRGLRITFADANGGTRTEVQDMTVVTCPVGCDDSEAAMAELGLLIR